MSRPSERYPDCWEEAEFEAESERMDKLAEAIAAEAEEEAGDPS